MLKKKIVESGLILSLVLALGAVAFAQSTTTTQPEATPQKKVEKKERKLGRHFKEGKRGRHGKFGKKAFGRLNLTDEQKAQMSTLRQQNREKFAAQHQELRTLGQKKRQGALTADEQARFDALKNELKASRQQMQEQMNSLLTVEQKQQLEQMKQEMKLRREERRKRWQERKQETKPSSGTVAK